MSCPPPSGTPRQSPEPHGPAQRGCSAGHADPAHPAQALAVPQAACSVSGGSLSVGVLEEDQVGKCGTRW